MKTDTLVPKMLGGGLSEAAEAYGGLAPLSIRLGWDETVVRDFANLEPLPELGGPIAFQFTIEDLEGMTQFQAMRWLEAMVIAKLSHLPVNLLSRFIGRGSKHECDVRRMQDRAIKFGLLRYDRFGRLREV